MRALLLCLIGLRRPTSSEFALAQTKPAPKAAPGHRDPLFHLDRRADGRQCRRDPEGDAPGQDRDVGAVLDVCYPADKTSDRKDRFVVDLAVNGQTLSGTTQSLGDKLPVTVKLTRKPTGDSFDFKGQISVGQTVTEVASTDNSDLSEKEFQDSQTTDDGIAAAPKDFTEVSPESIGVRVKTRVPRWISESLQRPERRDRARAASP